jgi:uncharacterized protein
MRYDIEVRKTRKRGNGVFALKNFKKGDIIEKCPIITMRPKERNFLEETLMAYYVYPWKSLNDCAVVFGYGSIYNHSYEPNAKWVRDYKNQKMVYKATADIKKGSEITINYNGEYGPPDELDWFDDEDLV